MARNAIQYTVVPIPVDPPKGKPSCHSLRQAPRPRPGRDSLLACKMHRGVLKLNEHPPQINSADQIALLSQRTREKPGSTATRRPNAWWHERPATPAICTSRRRQSQAYCCRGASRDRACARAGIILRRHVYHAAAMRAPDAIHPRLSHRRQAGPV
jgi:hypothetical protein